MRRDGADRKAPKRSQFARVLVVDRLTLRTNEGGIEPENEPISGRRHGAWGERRVAWGGSGEWRVAGEQWPVVNWRPVLDSFKGYFFGFSRGCRRPISTTRSVTIWILSKWSGL